MRVVVRLVPDLPSWTNDWQELWPLPRIGELIETPNRTYRVGTVAYYPFGDPNNDDLDPFIYVVATTI